MKIVKPTSNFSDIVRELMPLNIRLSRCPVGKNLDLPGLVTQDILNPAQKEQVLAAVDNQYNEFKRAAGYTWRDLMVVHPGSPHLYALITHFDRCHTHVDDEALYLLNGGIFGFVRPDGSQVELLLQPEDYINVPAGTEHWFCLTASLHLKAVRYFTTVGGWKPHYTDTEIFFRKADVRRYRNDCF